MGFPVSGDNGDLAERLWSVYSLERAADQATTPVSFALATVGITYAGTTIAVLINFSKVLPQVVHVLIPLALVGLYTSLTAIDSTSQARGRYMDELEEQLAKLHAADPAVTAAGISTPAPAVRQMTAPIHRRVAQPSKPKVLPAATFHPDALSGYFVIAYLIFILFFNGPVKWPEWISFTLYLVMMLHNFYQLLTAQTISRYEKLRSRVQLQRPANTPPLAG